MQKKEPAEASSMIFIVVFLFKVYIPFSAINEWIGSKNVIIVTAV